MRKLIYLFLISLFYISVQANNDRFQILESSKLATEPKIAMENNKVLPVNNRFAILESLNLAPEQKIAIENIKKEQLVKIQNLQKDLQKAQAELNLLQKDANSSDEDIEVVKSKIHNIQSSLSDIKVKSWLRIKNILTPEQNEQLRNLQLSH